MKRLARFLLVLLPMCLFAAGCGGSAVDKNPTDAGISKEKMEQMTKERLEDMQKAKMMMKKTQPPK